MLMAAVAFDGTPISEQAQVMCFLAC